MIVGFDGTILKGPKTGIGYYTYFLTIFLQRHHAEIDVRIFDGLRMRELGTEETVSDRRGARSLGWKDALLRHVRKIEAARRLKRILKAASFRHASRGVELHHATNFLPPAPISIPVLPLIHDVSHIRHPEWHPAERVRWLEERTAEFTDAPLINTVSHFSAGEIAATLGIEPHRVHVTYPGVNPVYRGEGSDERILVSSYDVAWGEFFLCVGALEPRKNLATVIASYLELPQQIQSRFPLLVVGPPGWGDLALPKGSENLQRRGALRFLGYVEETRMRALYRGCTAFLFPSSYEGFGMPVSEAMATGTRPVVARGGAPEEVAGPAGMSCEAFDTQAWRMAMLQAIDEKWHSNGALRDQLREASKRFRWKANAEATRKLYDLCLSETGRASS